MEAQITQEEIRRAMTRAKNGKAAGFDAIPLEVYKLLIEEVLPVWENLFNLVYTGKARLPES